MSKYINKYVAKAIAQVRSKNEKNIFGYIYFFENLDGTTLIEGDLMGLPYGYHAMHIHEKANTINCCESLGKHYNPFNKQHGDRVTKDMFGNEKINENRHVGDLGNIYVDNNGIAKFSFVDSLIKLKGPYSIMGRSIIIHQDKDDGGLSSHPLSKDTGNSGDRIAYGIIGYN